MVSAWQYWLGALAIVLLVIHELIVWRRNVVDRKAFDARMAAMKAKHEEWMAANQCRDRVIGVAANGALNKGDLVVINTDGTVSQARKR